MLRTVLVLAAVCAACDRHGDIRVTSPPPSYQEIGIGDTHILSFSLPDDDWRPVPGETRAFLYAQGGRSLRIVLDMSRQAFEAKAALVREIAANYAAEGAEVRPIGESPLAPREGFDALCAECAEGPHRAAHRVIRLGVWPELAIHAAWRGPIEEEPPIDAFMATFRLERR